MVDLHTHIKGSLSNISKDLRSKFDANQKNAWAHKDVGKHQVKRGDIFTIARPQKRSKPHEAKDNIEVLSKNILKIIFSISEPRSPN